MKVFPRKENEQNLFFLSQTAGSFPRRLCLTVKPDVLLMVTTAQKRMGGETPTRLLSDV